MAVLGRLGQETAPISLPNILANLPNDYAERTVRRWLDELVDEGLVKRSGQKRGTKYSIIKGGYFRPESALVIEQVRQPIYQREPVPYNDRWFEAYRPNVSFYIPADLRRQLYEMGQRSKIGDPAGTYAHQIFNRLLIDLSYNSSRLEGNTY